MAVEHGYMPLGKYSSARDDILHWMCINEWADDSFGNSGDYGLYAWRIDNDKQDVSTSNTEFNSLLSEWFEQNPEVKDSEELRSELIGHFMINEISNGAIVVWSFSSGQELMETYLAEQTRWEEWELDDEDRDE